MNDEFIVCHYCKEPTKNITKDHIFPKSKIRKLREKGEPLPEGVDLKDNKVLACQACNTNKGNKDYESFVSLGVKQIKHLKKLFIGKQFKKKKPYKKRRR